MSRKSKIIVAVVSGTIATMFIMRAITKIEEFNRLPLPEPVLANIWLPDGANMVKVFNHENVIVFDKPLNDFREKFPKNGVFMISSFMGGSFSVVIFNYHEGFYFRTTQRVKKPKDWAKEIIAAGKMEGGELVIYPEKYLPDDAVVLFGMFAVIGYGVCAVSAFYIFFPVKPKHSLKIHRKE